MTSETLVEIEEHCGDAPDFKWLEEHYHYIPGLLKHIRTLQSSVHNTQQEVRRVQQEIPNYFQRRNTR